MRIKDDCFNVEDRLRVKQQLISLIEQPSDTTVRPCPGCRFVNLKEQLTTSAKYCSFRCPAAANEMSSDPDKYPIEGAVVPIVYALYTLRLMMPCWSCEGHLDGMGNIGKHPKVWFYTTADFCPKLLAQYLSSLKAKKKIENEWGIRILPFSQSMLTTTYSLEPLKPKDSAEHLKSYQEDLYSIAVNLRKNILFIAKGYVDKINNSAFQR